MAGEAPAQDQWAQWLLERRFAGDAAQQKALLEMLYPIRDRVLEHAAIEEGDTVLDVGAGDGLIAFGAIAEVGQDGTVILSDISQDLLGTAHMLAERMGVLNRCRFVRAPADDLSVVPDESVDVVTTRSVLIYVDNKRAAFQEFFRVLRPGGRLSIFEPINRFSFPEPPGQLFGYDVRPVQQIADKMRAVYTRIHDPSTDSMMNFDERDLLAAADEAGFSEVHLVYEASIGPNRLALPWDTFIRTAFNPKAPTAEEAMQESLTPAETEELEGYLRPVMDAGPGIFRSAYAYLRAIKGRQSAEPAQMPG